MVRGDTNQQDRVTNPGDGVLLLEYFICVHLFGYEKSQEKRGTIYESIFYYRIVIILGSTVNE